ncbi:hypothetical protein LCGC14_2475810, partial [marine sediment metagenome]
MRDIYIVGGGPTHGTCKYDREAWGVNRGIRFSEFWKDGNKLFFFDDVATFDPNVMTVADLWNAKGIVEYLTTPKNVEYLKKYDIPASVYPLGEITEKFRSNYFANTICYMVAYAMYEKVDSIGLYGVD